MKYKKTKRGQYNKQKHPEESDKSCEESSTAVVLENTFHIVKNIYLS